MSAVLAAAPEIYLLLVGKEIRRDLHITFNPNDDHNRFRVALYPKGKGPYFERPFIAFGCGRELRFEEDLCIGGASFLLSATERERIEGWLKALPGGGT